MTDTDPWTTDIVATDGQTIRVRPIQPDDDQKMRALWSRLSPETIRLRFFTSMALSEAMLRYMVDVDFVDRFALVAEVRDEIIAVARFDRLPDEPDAADFAVTVQDSEQGRGIGTAMLRELLPPARAMGITCFHGDILKRNESMLKVMSEAGFEPAIKDYGETLSARFTTLPTETLLERAGQFDRDAARAALTAVFSPRSIAVVGASRDPGTIGSLVLGNLLRGGFTGVVYPVNPHTSHVQSVPTYPSLAECPTVPDLVFVCVPAPMAEAVVDQAGELGCKAAVLVGTGFSETGADGQLTEEGVLATARRHGIRLLGPNCMGAVNASADVQMNGSFSTVMPRPGRVGVSSQSGALGMAVLAAADEAGLGLSTFASVGNKVDISSNDLLQYWEADDDTDVIALYLESFGNPRTFARVARRIARTKPIVAVKGGRRAGEEMLVDALFDQTGVIQVPTLEQMFHVTSLLLTQPLPDGQRVGIVSNGVGPALLASDACTAGGLDVPPLSQETAALLAAAGLPLLGQPANPLQLEGRTSPAELGAAVGALAASQDVDAVIAIFTPPLPTEPDALAGALREVASDAGVPIIAVVMAADRQLRVLRSAGVPAVGFPESAADALAKVMRYSRWRRSPLGDFVRFEDVDDDAAGRLIATALADADSRWLPADMAVRLLATHGIGCAPHEVVRTADEAVDALDRLGGPVVVKPAAHINKTELGLVRLGVSRAQQLRDALEAMEVQVFRADVDEVLRDGWLVQQMIPDGVEMTITVRTDRTFGPVVEVGLGGTVAELLGDRSVRVLPLTDSDTEQMLQSLRSYPLLTGYRGAPVVAVGALRSLLLRVGALVEAHPSITQVELNPVFVRRHGATVVDARVHLRRADVSAER